MDRYYTEEQLISAQQGSYNEGWTDAIYTIFKKIEDNPLIRIDDLKQQLKYMGK